MGREAAELQVELGTGRGSFLTKTAKKNPADLYIGLEKVPDVIYDVVLKAKAAELQNIRLVMSDISSVEEIFAMHEVDRFYINFCDPWPKKRYTKRRLTHIDFLRKYQKLLESGGQLHFKTDNERLFEFSLNHFAAADLIISNITFYLYNSGFAGNIMTEYEEKFSLQGMKIFRCEVQFR